MKIEKISSLALKVSAAIALVCFVAFFAAGDSGEYIGDNPVPVLIDLVMGLMYVMGGVTFALTVWSVIRSVLANRGNNSASTTGVPSGAITVCVLVLLLASLAVGVVLGLGAEDFTAADGTVTTGPWVTLVDTFCTSIGIMMVAAALAVAVSMTGFLTKSASK